MVALGASGCRSMQTNNDHYDLLIRNGRIVDGSGAPWFRGDVAVRGDTIVAVGNLHEQKATIVIDAKDNVIAPGFIDLLGHSEPSVLVDPRLESKVRQGVTTELTGEGVTLAPMSDTSATEPNEDLRGKKPTWRTLGEFMAEIESRKPTINFAFLVTTSNIRLMTLGRINRAPTAAELDEMMRNVDQAMRDGAVGISTALIYVPAVFATTEEIIELSKVAASHGGVYFTHMRNEADFIDSALDETFRIGREAGIPLNIWHLKIGGTYNWGKMPHIIQKIEEQRAAGIDVAANIYPYIASKTSLSTIVESWALEGGYAELRKRLATRELRLRIGDEIRNSPFWRRIGGAQNILITDVPDGPLQAQRRKRLSDIADAIGTDPVDAALQLMESSRSSPGAMFFSMNEEDVKTALRTPWVSVGADSSAFVSDADAIGAHPRAYGTFPRVIGHYVRDEKLFTLEEAVRKITSQAASRARLYDRGLLRPGMRADIVVFDPEGVRDLSTYEDSHHMSVGIEHVIVNGRSVLKDGQLTGERPGRVLRPGRRPSMDGRN